MLNKSKENSRNPEMPKSCPFDHWYLSCNIRIPPICLPRYSGGPPQQKHKEEGSILDFEIEI
jgi:hypothetical protein